MKKIFVSIVLLFALLGGLSSPIFPLSANRGDEAVDVFVIFENIPGNQEKALLQKAGAKIKHSYTIVPAVAVSLPAKAVSALQKNPKVAGIELDGIVYALDLASELDNTWGVKHIGTGEVHSNGILGAGVKVAVLDTGIDYSHPELADVYKGGYDFVNNDDNPMDDQGHGTHVAGTIAAVRNGQAVVGVAPLIEIYALKTLSQDGSGSWSNVVAALEWAINNGINITNNSYGSSLDPGSIVKMAFDKATEQGILHIASAGNSGNPQGRGDNVGYPARYDSVVAVAATDQSDARAKWSSTGLTVEISAPGVSINSTILGGGYGEKSGTSMACPHVSGVAALVMSAGESNAAKVRTILQETAKPLGRADHYGFGLVQASAALSIVPPEPQPEYAVSVISPDDSQENSIGTHQYVFIVTNTGTMDDAYDLFVDSSNNNFVVSIEQNSIALGKNSSTEVIAQVEISSSTQSGGSAVVSLRAESRNSDASAFDQMLIYYQQEEAQSSPNIDRFDLIDMSNPALVKVSVQWEVSDNDGDLDTVETKMELNEQVVASAVSNVSGFQASGVHELKVKRGGTKTYQITIIVVDKKGNFYTQSKSIDI